MAPEESRAIGGRNPSSGRTDEAAAAVERALALDGDIWHARFVRGGMKLDRGDPRARAARHGAHTRRRPDGARAVLAELETQARTRYVPASSSAAVHLGPGDRAAIFRHARRQMGVQVLGKGE